MTSKRIIFHIDVNSAYLSWEAVYRLQHGFNTDLRTIPSAVGGNPKSRHGIILAKSIPAKKYGIKTGESLFEAKGKYPKLFVASPNYELYMKCSNAMFSILREYSSVIQRYSIDECFLDYTQSMNLLGNPIDAAYKIKDRIRDELGFTVNIGISTNKLLAKMASELQKPDKVHTIFPNEIKEKMWPLPVNELFMVGSRTMPKLRKIGINTIEDLAKANPEHMKAYLKSYGFLIWSYANGIEDSPVRNEGYSNPKGIGNSTTIHYDVTNKYEAHLILLSLTEMVCMRLRNINAMANVVSVSIKNFGFVKYSHQKTMFNPTDCTNIIFDNVKKLFDEVWKGEPIRHLGIRLTGLFENNIYQSSFLDEKYLDKYRSIDRTVDSIRKRYGKNSIVRGAFINSGLKPIKGGVGEDEYQMMSSIL